MTKQIKATEIKPGMIVLIHGGTERFDVTKAVSDKYGAVTLTDARDEHRALSRNETVTFLAHFNP